MNELIRELAEQARTHAEKTVHHYMGQFDGVTTWESKILKVRDLKFAELIVRECVTIVVDAVDHREPASTYASKIQQHFGVEE